MDFSLYSLENLRTLPVWFVSMIIAGFSSLLGSFINVCIYRIPLGNSIVYPRSRCTTCDHVLEVPDLIPIFSWIFLSGKCRHCGAKVSPRYACVEALIVFVWVLSFISFGLTLTFLITAVLISLFITVAGIAIYSKHIKKDKAVVNDKKGLTFIEILFTAVILAAVVGPFFTSNLTDRATAARNRERIQAYGLAREKLQELRCLPARKVVSDWLIYRGEGSGLSKNIFRDLIFGIWAEMDDSGDVFWQNMTDVFTVDGNCAGDEQMPPQVFEKFKNNFKNYYGFDYEPYPDSYRMFRRTTKVEDMTKSDNPGNILKRVVVTVEIKSRAHVNGYKIRLATYLGDS